MTRARNPVVFLDEKMCMALRDLVHYCQFHNIKLQARTLVGVAELVGTGKRQPPSIAVHHWTYFLHRQPVSDLFQAAISLCPLLDYNENRW